MVLRNRDNNEDNVCYSISGNILSALTYCISHSAKVNVTAKHGNPSRRLIYAIVEIFMGILGRLANDS